MAKVSIVMPVYNAAPFLAESLASALRQTLQDIEIVCVNDGSTDSSLELLRLYEKKDRRMVVLDQPNGGYGKAMNTGIDHASGEYIGILEPDDYLYLDMYREQYEYAVKYDLDLVKSDFYRFTRDSAGNMRLILQKLSTVPSDYRKVFNSSEDPYTIRFVMNTWSGIYRREFLLENHIRHNETPGASYQDNGFYFQTFAFARRGMLLETPGYRYRIDNPGSSIHNPGKVYAMNEEYDYIRRILESRPGLWERFQYAYWRRRYLNYQVTLQRIGGEYKRDFVYHISGEMKNALSSGEMRKKEFNKWQWRDIRMLMKKPEEYYHKALLM
ncbi:MAG: glycosyltransferase [Blautia sp.]|nr:glycosyltransferase [Blautia sp.]